MLREDWSWLRLRARHTAGGEAAVYIHTCSNGWQGKHFFENVEGKGPGCDF